MTYTDNEMKKALNKKNKLQKEVEDTLTEYKNHLVNSIDVFFMEYFQVMQVQNQKTKEKIKAKVELDTNFQAIENLLAELCLKNLSIEIELEEQLSKF